MDNDGDIEVVSVTFLKKPTPAQQQLYVLDALKRVNGTIPTKYDEFYAFVQKFFSFKVDEVVLHNTWSLLSKCLNNVKKPMKCENVNESIIIESDDDCINEEDIKKATSLKTSPIKKGKKTLLKHQETKHLKKEILQVMKNLSPESNGNLAPQSSITHLYSKKVARLIQKKLEIKNEITLIKKEKWKSSCDDEEEKQQIEKMIVKKPKKRRKSEPDKKRRRSKLSKEEEADKLRMDLFIDKIIELSLPVTAIQNRNKRKRHSI